MFCPKCAQEASPGCIICPHCLTPLDPAGKAPSADKKTKAAKSDASIRRRNGWIIVVSVIAVMVIFAAALFFFSGCTTPSSLSDPAGQTDDAMITGWYEDGSFALSGTDATLYAGTPIVGTWVLQEDYEDGYDDWDNIAEYTSDGYVYEWYGDGLGYYNPLCAYTYDGDTLTYHYYQTLGTPEDYDAVFSCEINSGIMTTTDQQGISSQFIRISDEINLSADEVKALYPES